MTISFNKACICAALYFLAQAAVGADHDQSAKINQLEQRIAELETIVQLLLKQNSSQLSQTKDQKPTSTTNEGAGIGYQKLDEASINQKNIAKNSAAIEKIAEISDRAEMAIFSYDDLSTELNNSIKVAGYADVEYRGSTEPGVNEEFRMHHLSLFFTKQFENRIKFFSEIEYEDAPKFEGKNDGSGELKESSGKIFVEAVNFDWNYSQYLNIRVGRFFTPAGIWSEDHYPPFVTSQERPLLVRRIFPQLVDGLSIFGSTEFAKNHFFDYTTFVGNGESSASGKKDLNSSKAVGFKGDYHAPWLDDFTLGFTLYNDNNDSANNAAKKFAYGYHVKLRQENLSFQAEYVDAELEFSYRQNDYRSSGYYSQFLYSVGQWGLGYRYDAFDKNDLDIEKIKRNTFFVNYHLNEYFTLKGEYHDDSHDDPLIDEYGYYVFSVTGYLGN